MVKKLGTEFSMDVEPDISNLSHDDVEDQEMAQVNRIDNIASQQFRDGESTTVQRDDLRAHLKRICKT